MKKWLSKRDVGGFSLKSEYVQCFEFLKESKNYIYSAVLLFFIFAAIGFFFEDLVNLFLNNTLGLNLNEMILGYVRNLLLETEGMTQKEITGFIFMNNLQSSFTGMIFGLFLGVVPFFGIVFNGYVLGFVAMMSVREAGYFILWRILPHGVFELPAVFISLALGLRLGTFYIIEKNKSDLGRIAFNSLRVFLLVVFPLLFLAAIIEGALIALTG